jgi:hypothetical protein
MSAGNRSLMDHQDGKIPGACRTCSKSDRLLGIRFLRAGFLESEELGMVELQYSGFGSWAVRAVVMSGQARRSAANRFGFMMWLWDWMKDKYGTERRHAECTACGRMPQLRVFVACSHFGDFVFAGEAKGIEGSDLALGEVGLGGAFRELGVAGADVDSAR